MVRPLLIANFPRVVGGGEIGLLELAGCLRDKGHRPLIALPGKSAMADDFDRCLISQSVTAGAADIRYIASDFDLIHAHGARGLTAAWMARVGKPVIWHARVAAHDQLDPFLMRLPDIIIANSKATASRFGSRTNVRVVYNGINPPLPSEEKLPLSQSKKKIGVIGRMTPEKGIQDLLPVLIEIARQRADIEIIFAGDDSGPIGDSVREEIALSGLGDRFRMLGFVNSIARHFSEFDLIVMPSRVEGFGRVAVEALGAGVRVIARKVGGLAEVLSEVEDPWLPENTVGWATKILSELDHPHDPEPLKRAALRFTLENHADEVISIYHELLKR